jgi:hypothetical protein
MADDMIGAAVLLGVAWVLCVVALLVSEELGIFTVKQRHALNLGFGLALVVVSVGLFIWERADRPKTNADETAQLLEAIREGRAPAALQGRLTYANLEAKLYNCPIKPGVAFGTVVMEASQFPLTIVKIDRKPIVQVDRVRGNLTLSQLYLFDGQDHVIASIHDTDFWVKPGYHAVQDSPSDLTVFSPSEELLLRVVLINSDLISVEGKLRYHNKLVEIADRQISLGQVRFRETCFPNYSIYIEGDEYGAKPEPAPWFSKPTQTPPATAPNK